MNLNCNEPSLIGLNSNLEAVALAEEDDEERMFCSVQECNMMLSCDGKNHDVSNLISKYHQYRQSVVLPKKRAKAGMMIGGEREEAETATTRRTARTNLKKSKSWSPRSSLYPNKSDIEDSTKDTPPLTPPSFREWMSDSDCRYSEDNNTSTTSHHPLHMAEHDQELQKLKQEERPVDSWVSTWVTSGANNPALDDQPEEEEEDASLAFLYQLQQEQEQQRQTQQLLDQAVAEEAEHALLEIAPGLLVPYVGTAERTRNLIHTSAKKELAKDEKQSMTIQETFCFSCQACLVCMVGVQYVACIACHTVSPLSSSADGSTTTTIITHNNNGHQQPGAAGIGLLVEEADVIKRQARFCSSA